MTTLAIPDLDPDVDNLAAALAYAKHAWYVLPVRRGLKDPGSIVGKGWHNKSSRDPHVIAAWFAGTDHGIALHAGRSGAVIFDVDRPAKLPDVLRTAIDDHRPPQQSTRPDVPGRGHYLFRQPPDRVLGNGVGSLGGSWGEIRGANGVIIAAPSIHEAADGLYRWTRTGTVPELPDSLGTLLRDASPSEDAATDAAIAEFLTRHTGAGQPNLLPAWVATYRRKIADGESRHMRAISVLAGMLKEAAAGCFPAADAAAQLRAEFLTAVARPPVGQQGEPRYGPVAESEWAGILAWAIGQANAADPAETRTRLKEHAPGDVFALVPPFTHAATPASAVDGTAAVAYLDEPVIDKPRTSWWPRDLEPVLTGHKVEPEPVHLVRSDGQPLFYGGKVNGVIGESESGKTWIVLLAATQALADGIPVSYLDFEDTDTGVVARLRALGTSDDRIRELFRYLGPDQALDAVASGDLREHLTQHRPGLVVLDGVNAAMTLLGLDLMSNSDATRFAQILLRPVADTGACVAYVDHIPKSKDNETKGGIGAQAKRAMTTGATLRAEVVLPFGRGQAGKIRLTVDKDRPGYVRGASSVSKTVGTAVITPGPGDSLTLEIEAPDLRPADERGPFRPTGLMEKVCGALAVAPDGLSGREIETAVRGKATAVREAVQRLIEESFILAQSGPRRSTIHTLVRRYSEAEDLAGEYLTDSPDSVRPSASQCVPDEVPSAPTSASRDRVPPPIGGTRDALTAVDDEDNPETTAGTHSTPDALAGMSDAGLIRAARARGATPAWHNGQLVDMRTGEVIEA